MISNSKRKVVKRLTVASFSCARMLDDVDGEVHMIVRCQTMASTPNVLKKYEFA